MARATAIAVITVSLLASFLLGLGSVASPPTGNPSSAPSAALHTASTRLSGPNPPYELRWLGAPKPVLSLSNGYWDNLGQLLTVGGAAYSCYANTSSAGGLAPNNLYLVTNESGSWEAYLAGAPLSAMVGDPTCSIALGQLGGHTIEFIAFLSPQNTSEGALPSVQLVYNPSGSPTGPWVHLSVDPPGVSYEGSIGGNYPDGPTVAIWNNDTIVIAYQNFPPVYTNAPSPEVWVESLPLSALPTAPGGQPSEPWFVQIPTSGDGVNGLLADRSPVVTADPAGVELVFQRGCACSSNGTPEVQLAYYNGTVGTDQYTYVTDGGSDFVSAISEVTGGVAANVSAGTYPDGAAYDSTTGNVFVANGGSNIIVDNVSLTAQFLPDGAAYDSANGDVYVADEDTNNVSVIWGPTNTVVTTIPVGVEPAGVAYDGQTGNVYVANSGSANVSVINGTTNTVHATVPAGSAPDGVAYDPGNGEVYVTNAGSNTASVIAGKTNTVVTTISTGTEPDAAAYDATNGDIYVANYDTNNVSVIAPTTNTVVATTAVGNGSDGVAYDPSNGDVYVTNFATGNVSVIDSLSNRVVATVSVGLGPDAATYDSADGDMFVGNSVSENLSVIASTTNVVVGSITMGAGPLAVTFDPENGDVYSANTGSNVSVIRATLIQGSSNSVSVINEVTNSVVATLAVGNGPEGVAYDGATGDVYVANADSDNVSVIWGLTNAVVGAVSVGSEPEGVAYDSADGTVYVANNGSANVSVIDGTNDTLLTTIPVGSSPQSLAYDTQNGDVYVANRDSHNVSVIDGARNAVVATIPVGTDPDAVTFDSASGDVYVANAGSGSVSVIRGATDTVVATLAVGVDPSGAGYDFENQDVVVTNLVSNTVTEIRGTSVVATVPVGVFPESAAYDNGSGNVAWSNGTGDPFIVASYPGSGNLGMSVGFLSTRSGENFAAYTNSSSVGMQLDAAVGSGTSWSNFSLGSVVASSSTLLETPGVTSGACGLSIGDTMNTNSSTGTVVPTVWTLNNSGWTTSVFGATNNSNAVPSFVDVAAQGKYLDTLFVNQPGGGGSGTTVFYADQAICTNSTLNSVTTNVATLSLVAGGSSGLRAQALDASGAPLSAASGVTYTWAVVPPSLGSFNSTSGSEVEFTAGGSGENGTITVTARQSGTSSSAEISVAITSGKSPALPANTPGNNDLLVAAVAAVAVAAGGAGYALVHARHARLAKAPKPPPPTPPAPPPP